ncbi:MAG: TetR family transcriptional regulator [Proteobacteria bacterium]|nr:TetR family transcriptional regulator [Pseudomonadota bacterium]
MGEPPATARKARPGRPDTDGQVRERILDVAEQMFAEHGYAGTSLRDITARVNVTQALVRYYFGSKRGLFEETFLRGGRQLVEARMENLRALTQRTDAPSPRALVEAFLRPALRMVHTDHGRAFIRLQARLHTEPRDLQYRLRHEVYDSCTQLYLEALARAMPSMDRRVLYWRLTLLVGTYLYAISDAHRLEDFSRGLCDPHDPAELERELTDFVLAGLRAPSRR